MGRLTSRSPSPSRSTSKSMSKTTSTTKTTDGSPGESHLVQLPGALVAFSEDGFPVLAVGVGRHLRRAAQAGGLRVGEDVDIEQKGMLVAAVQANDLAVDRFALLQLGDGAKLDIFPAAPKDRIGVTLALAVDENHVLVGGLGGSAAVVVRCHWRIVIIPGTRAHVGRTRTWIFIEFTDYNNRSGDCWELHGFVGR